MAHAALARVPWCHAGHQPMAVATGKCRHGKHGTPCVTATRLCRKVLRKSGFADLDFPPQPQATDKDVHIKHEFYTVRRAIGMRTIPMLMPTEPGARSHLATVCLRAAASRSCSAAERARASSRLARQLALLACRSVSSSHCAAACAGQKPERVQDYGLFPLGCAVT